MYDILASPDQTPGRPGAPTPARPPGRQSRSGRRACCGNGAMGDRFVVSVAARGYEAVDQGELTGNGIGPVSLEERIRFHREMGESGANPFMNAASGTPRPLKRRRRTIPSMAEEWRVSLVVHDDGSLFRKSRFRDLLRSRLGDDVAVSVVQMDIFL